MLGLVPVLGLGVVRVGDGGPVVPVLGFAGLGVLDLLGGEEVPVGLQVAGLDLFVVDFDFVGVVGVDDEGVEVGEDVVLAPDLLLDEVVLALVAEDNVDFLGARATNVRA